MKTNFTLVIIIFTLLTGTSCNPGSNEKIPGDVVYNPATASGKSTGQGVPEIKFEETEHDFGKVIRGEVVVYSFKFKNTGKGDLLISDISTSCGCTASEYPKTPVKPGEESFVKVTFNSSNRRGFQHKTVTVAANTQPANTTLIIKAMVTVPEEN